MKKIYKQLSIEEREIIQQGIWAKKSIREIALELDRLPGTISRELRRNAPFFLGLSNKLCLAIYLTVPRLNLHQG